MATQERLTGDVKNLALAELGTRKIEWANLQMPVLQLIRKRFIKEQPLKGIRVSACLHVTSETANLAITLRDGGGPRPPDRDRGPCSEIPVVSGHHRWLTGLLGRP